VSILIITKMLATSRPKISSWNAWTLKVKTVCPSETSITIHQIVGRLIADEFNLQIRGTYARLSQAKSLVSTIYRLWTG
jgi:hypothetical protein